MALADPLRPCIAATAAGRPQALHGHESPPGGASLLLASRAACRPADAGVLLKSGIAVPAARIAGRAGHRQYSGPIPPNAYVKNARCAGQPIEISQSMRPQASCMSTGCKPRRSWSTGAIIHRLAPAARRVIHSRTAPVHIAVHKRARVVCRWSGQLAFAPWRA
jgi:hypothetical protein